MPRILFSTILLFVLLSDTYSGAEIYPVMPGVNINPDFSVRINDGSGFKSVAVQDIVDVCFVHFANSGSTKIEITVNQTIETWRISPERLGIIPEVIDSIMTFTITDTAKIIVLINEDAGNHTKGLDGLCIFADAPEVSVPSLGDPDVINIMDYDVDSSGQILSRAKIQKAFDDHNGQGKIIYFPPGIYKTGMLHLRGRQSMYLAPGAVLMGSANYDDYNQIPGEGSSNEEYLIGSWKSDSIRIFGRGIINGNGTALRLQDPTGAGFKTHNIQFQGSKNISIEGIICLNAGSWAIEPIYCDHIMIRNVKILSDLRYYDSKNNTDGIDMNNCRHVRVNDCLIWSGDDAITPKQDHTYQGVFPRGNVYNHIYDNIVVFTRKCAVKVGSETLDANQDFFNLTFRNFDVTYSDRAMCIWSEGGALIHYVTFENFNIEETGTEVQNKNSHIHCRIDSDGNSIKDIDFLNIKAKEPALNGSTFNGDNLNSTINGKLVQYYNIHFSDYTIGGEPVLSLDDPNANFNLEDDFVSADSSAFSFSSTTDLHSIRLEPEITFSIHPNPVNNLCSIDISLSKKESVEITVSNLSGQVVDKLINEALPGGKHSFVWDATATPEGVFLISLNTESIQRTLRIVKL